jgi:hypothetical protein
MAWLDIHLSVVSIHLYRATTIRNPRLSGRVRNSGNTSSLVTLMKRTIEVLNIHFTARRPWDEEA